MRTRMMMPGRGAKFFNPTKPTVVSACARTSDSLPRRDKPRNPTLWRASMRNANSARQLWTSRIIVLTKDDKSRICISGNLATSIRDAVVNAGICSSVSTPLIKRTSSPTVVRKEKSSLVNSVFDLARTRDAWISTHTHTHQTFAAHIQNTYTHASLS